MGIKVPYLEKRENSHDVNPTLRHRLGTLIDGGQHPGCLIGVKKLERMGIERKGDRLARDLVRSRSEGAQYLLMTEMDSIKYSDGYSRSRVSDIP